MNRNDIQAKLLKLARDAVLEAVAQKEALFRANLDFLNKLVEKIVEPGAAHVDAFATLITEHEDWLRAAHAVRDNLESAIGCPLGAATCAATVAAVQAAQGVPIEAAPGGVVDTTPLSIYLDVWELLDQIMGQAGDAIWAAPGTTAHEALLDIIAARHPEYSAFFQAKMEE